MTASAFQATFADFRLIKGRKVGQLIFELPIEAVDAALETLGGVPRPDKEAWVAVARIDPAKAASASPEPVKERRKFSDLPMSAQAAMRCDDATFRSYLRSRGFFIDNAKDADAAVKDLLTINSKKEILPDTPAGLGWLELMRQFENWMRS